MIFTEKNVQTLQDLFLEIGFSGELLTGKFGANSFSVVDLLHHTSITTLQGLYSQLKKEIAAFDQEDDWSNDNATQAKINSLSKWKEFIHLVIGYKKSIVEKETQLAQERKTKAKTLATLMKVKEEKEIEELSKLSSEELSAKIAELS